MFLSDSLVLEVNNATSRCYRIDYKLAKCWIQWITQTEFTEWTRKKTNAIFFSRWIVSLWKYEKITKVVLRIYREIYSTGGIIHVYCPYLANNLIQLFSVCHRAYECLLFFFTFSLPRSLSVLVKLLDRLQFVFMCPFAVWVRSRTTELSLRK